MIERPMLFLSNLARLLARGEKTVTRRPVSTQVARERADLSGWDSRFEVDDVIWVRETWRVVATGASGTAVAYKAGGSNRTFAGHHGVEPTSKWRPSMHMPRWAARTLLRVTESRVERLQPLSDAEAIAEGFKSSQDFTNAWDSIYRESGKTISTRPLVVVTRFVKLDG